jgi:heptosyltransferase-2
VQNAVIYSLKHWAHQAICWFTSPQLAYFIGEILLYRHGKNPQINISDIRHILVIRLDEIGDMVLTTPFLRELRRNFSEAWITLVVKPGVFNLIELCPYIDEIFTYDGNPAGRLWRIQRHLLAWRLARKYLWHRRFDLAVMPRWGKDSYHAKCLAYFSGARWRVAYAEEADREAGHSEGSPDILLTHPVQNSPYEHSVQKHLDILRFLNLTVCTDALELWTDDADEALADQIQNQIDAKKILIAMIPGSGKIYKCWPATRFAEIGKWMQKELNAHILLFGGATERSLGEFLEKELANSCTNLIHQTTLRQTTALLKRCKLFIGNDSGPMHMAAAVHLPVLEISMHPRNGDPDHPYSPRRFGPYRTQHIVLQPNQARPPCEKACTANEPHCILNVTVEDVTRGISELYNRGVD